MNFPAFVGVALAALGLAQPLFAQDELPPGVRKPFRLDEEPAIPRAVPVERPAPRAVPVATPPPAVVPPQPPTAVPPPKPMETPQPDDPGTIRIAPTGTARSPDQVQIDLADGFYAKRMYDMAAPEYERFLALYPGSADRPSALFRLGESYRHTGALNASKNAYETLLTQYQSGEFIGPAAYRLAELYYQGKEFRQALTLYRKASVRLKDPAVTNSAKFFTGRSLEALGQKLEARNVYEDLVGTLENNPFQNASRLSLALLLKDAGRTADALKHVQALAKQAENPELKVEATVRSGLWLLELQPPQPAQAETEFKAALEMPVQSRWKEIAQVGLLRVFFDSGKFQEVIDAYTRQAGQFSPELKPEVLTLAANAYRQLGKPSEALALYDQVIGEAPNSVQARDAQFERLRTLYATEDETLVGEIDKFLLTSPDFPKRDEVLLMKAETLLKKQDYAGAVPLYSTLELSRQLSPARKAEALFRLGWCHIQLQDLDRAIKAFTTFIETYPSHNLMSYALIQRGLAQQSLKNLSGAVKDYDAIIKHHPKAKERELALQQKAIIQGQQGDNAGMSESFKLLLKDYPDTAAKSQAKYWIGWAAFEAKNYKDAVAYLDQARQLDPEQFGEKASIRVLLAHYFLEDKAATAKEVDFYAKEGKTKVPAEILRWLGSELFKASAYEAAEKYYLMLSSREEVMPDDYLFLGRCQDKLGKYEEAVGSFESYLSAVKLPVPRANGLLMLAESQIGLKALDEAQKSVDEALTLQPEGDINGEGRIVAGDIQMARENYEEAAKVYESVAVILDNAEITPRALEKAVKAWQADGEEEKAKKTLNTLQSRYPEYLRSTSKKP